MTEHVPGGIFAVTQDAELSFYSESDQKGKNMKKRKLEGIGLLSLLAIAGVPVVASAQNLNGEEIFTRNCSVCRSLTPPPKTAPPVMAIANRYRLKFSTKQQGVDAMAAFLKSPDKNRAINPVAVSRFGLMPPQPLKDVELKAVSSWVWDQYRAQTGRGFRQCRQANR